MANIKGGRKKKSLCEKSMVLVANIIRLSSLPLSNMSSTFETSMRSPQPRPPPPPPADHKTSVGVRSKSTTTGKVTSRRSSGATSKVVLDVVPQRSQEQENESKKPFSYLMQPITDDQVSVKRGQLDRDPDDVDARAEDFIRRIRGREKKQFEQNDLLNTTTSTTTTSTASKRFGYSYSSLIN